MVKSLNGMSLEELWQLFPIVLQEHTPAYSEWYCAEKENLIKAIGQDCIERISHIGSTAVEGLLSKSTVDILLEICDNCDTEQLKAKLIQAGWICMSSESAPKLKIIFNKGYTPLGFAEKVFHLHVRHSGNWNELYFRHYLQSHKQIADEYGKLKISLKKQYEHNRDGYTAAKEDFIMKYTDMAREEFADRYNPRK